MPKGSASISLRRPLSRRRYLRSRRAWRMAPGARPRARPLPRMRPQPWLGGEAFFRERRGQLGLSCADCHERYKGPAYVAIAFPRA